MTKHSLVNLEDVERLTTLTSPSFLSSNLQFEKNLIFQIKSQTFRELKQLELNIYYIT